ncbi:hypothetical protein QBC44DRAFT_370449 [Cladorrhinum sp. PSN332]|nr:hypothetical protein QBC44DRAFT_370449 [Cladorrhinum sp. PSN332]
MSTTTIWVNGHYPHNIRVNYTQLYHVYDSLSQSPYKQREGIRAKRRLVCNREYKSIQKRQPHDPTLAFSKETTERHLDWSNRTPSPYISVWDDWKAAVKHAQARDESPMVYDSITKRSTHRGDTFIATTDARTLIGIGGIIFCPNKCTIYDPQNIPAPRRDAGFPRNEHEWLVGNQIRNSAVLSVVKLTPDENVQPAIAPNSSIIPQARNMALRKLQTLAPFPLFTDRCNFSPEKAASYIRSMEHTHWSVQRNSNYSSCSPYISYNDMYSMAVWQQILATNNRSSVLLSPDDLLNMYFIMLRDEGSKALWADYQDRFSTLASTRYYQ